MTGVQTCALPIFPMGVAVEEFDVRQMVDNPLLTPRGLLPSSEEDEMDIGVEAVAASADLKEERRRRKNKHRFNKTAAKLVLQKRGALQTRRQHRVEGEGEGEGETLPRLIELRSDSSGVSSDHYFSPRSSISTDESVRTMHTPGEGTPKDLSPRQGGRSGKRRRRRHKSRKRVYRKRYTTTIRRK